MEVFILFSLRSIISCISILSICVTLSSHVLAIRERMAINMQGTVFTLTRLKIVLTIKNLNCICLLYNCEM